jgi:ABC-type branched-subunit amino acid transport system ATPase component
VLLRKGNEPRGAAAGAPSGALLAARDIGVSFSGLRALEKISFDLENGELMGLIGPNGAGKTTLVNVLTGFQRPDTGQVWLDGEPVTRLPPAERARKGLTRTFQGARLFGHLTVQENIEVSAMSRGTRRVARAHAQEAIALLGLAHAANTPAGVLPYGDQRRLALARCLALQPKAILLDEPAAGLDERETAELGDAIEQVRREQRISILLIEHDVALVMRLSDRVLVLAEGRPIAIGPPRQIRENPAVIAAYLGADDADS